MPAGDTRARRKMGEIQTILPHPSARGCLRETRGEFFQPIMVIVRVACEKENQGERHKVSKDLTSSDALELGEFTIVDGVDIVIRTQIIR